MDFLSELNGYFSTLELLENCQGFTDLTDSMKDQVEALKLGLRFLITFFKFIPRNESFDFFLEHSKSAIISAGSGLVSLNLRLSDDFRTDMGNVVCDMPHKIRQIWSTIALCCPTSVSDDPVDFRTDMENVVCDMLDKIQQSWSTIAFCCTFLPTSVSDDPEDLVKFVDDLVKNFTDLLISRAYSFHLPDPVKTQVKDLQQELIFLMNLLVHASAGRDDYQGTEDLLTHGRSVALQAAGLFYICLVGKLSTEIALDMNLKFSDLIRKIKPIQLDVRQIYMRVLKDSSSSGSSVLSPPELKYECEDFLGSVLDFFPKLLTLKASYMISFRDRMTMLEVELRFLKNFLNDFPKQCTNQAKSEIMNSIDAATRESGSVIFSLFVNEAKVDISKQIYPKLSDLLEKVKLIKEDIKQRFLPLMTESRCKFPRIGGLEFIEFLLGNIKELLKSKADSIVTLKQEIETIGRELESLAFDMANQCNEREGMNNLWTQMVNVAYQAEYVIDSFVIKDNPQWYCVLWLSDVKEQIQRIKSDLKEINRKKDVDTGVVNVLQPTSNTLSLQANVQSEGEIIVGFVPETAILIQRLTRGPKHLDIVSIEGMSGLGKSTLAKKLYRHPSVTSYFYICIWCYVSPVYEKRRLLLDILDNLDVKAIDEESSNASLEEMVYQSLKRKRYLLVLDDIWNIKAWNVLKFSFPEDNNGSRVMVTSQLLDVARSEGNNLLLRPFDNTESWELFSNIAFKQKSCPPELEQIGNKIVESCKGVPLAVSLVAGLLVNTDKKEDWKQVEKNMSSPAVGDRKELCTRIAGLSYKNLPNHLKSCFLYFGAFTRDPEVPTKRLIRLWTAEGFVRKAEKQSLEETAEGYLDQLISRSLVKTAKFKSTGGVKTCQVHDLVRDFCSAKAEEENALKVISHCQPHTETYEHHRFYRICTGSQLKMIVWPSSSQHSRTLLYSGASCTPIWGESCDFNHFKLLRVLDTGLYNVGEFPTSLILLVHLRYLAMRTVANTIPPSLAHLGNLETVIITGTRGQIFLPDTIWKMAKLRHLHINQSATFPFDYQGEENNENSQLLLDDLETISTPCLRYGKNSEKMLCKFRNVRKMRCIFLDSFESIIIWGKGKRRRRNRFPKLEVLSQLESLKVFYHGVHPSHPCEFSFPSNLKKLILSKFRLPWNEISGIGKLPNLEVLKLRLKAFEGPRWDMIDGEFEKLKYLELYNLDVSEWKACSDPFPKLRTLILRSCKKLKAVPLIFGDIRMLERIDVHWCSRSATDSVKQIRQDQQEQANEEIHFSILPRDWDIGPSSQDL